jgi:hypothetical protein
MIIYLLIELEPTGKIHLKEWFVDQQNDDKILDILSPII